MVKIRDPSDFLGLNPGSSKYKLCDLGQVEWHLLFWWLILLSAWHSAMCWGVRTTASLNIVKRDKRLYGSSTVPDTLEIKTIFDK